MEFLETNMVVPCMLACLSPTEGYFIEKGLAISLFVYDRTHIVTKVIVEDVFIIGHPFALEYPILNT